MYPVSNFSASKILETKIKCVHKSAMMCFSMTMESVLSSNATVFSAGVCSECRSICPCDGMWIDILIKGSGTGVNCGAMEAH